MTILFAKDWKTENGRYRAMPHVQTKNKTFLRTCQLLKRLGVKNFLFPLALYDPDLKDVDVHDLEDNTPENEILRTKVIREARINIWYFLREVVRIFNQGGSPVPFRLDRGNMAMIWCFMNNIDYATLQPRQTGKEQPLSAFIRTPDGWSRMRDMAVGKTVVTPDGSHATVTGVYPQGMKPIYRLYFEDGRWSDCGEEHLWKVYSSEWVNDFEDGWRILTLRDMIAYGKPLSIPLINPEYTEERTLPVDPYLLGVLLSDNTTITDQIMIRRVAPAVRDAVVACVPNGYLVGEYDCKIKGFYITPTDESGQEGLLSQLGIKGNLSRNKTIPDVYLNAAPSQKWALIRGMMDASGIVSTGRNPSVEFRTTSLRLSHQLQDIVRSLGGICALKEYRSHNTHNGLNRVGGIVYRVLPKFGDPKQLFKVVSPQGLDLISVEDELKLKIRTIDYLGEQEAQCIEVDHPDHLYITNDYVATHNTIGALTTYTWLLFCGGYESQFGMMTKDNKLREDNVSRIKRISECLPSWWLAKDKFKDKNNATAIRYDALKTELATVVAQDNPVDADKQGRGGTMPVFWWDEFEFCSNIDVSYSTIIASGGAARKNAKANGRPHSNIITTTAGDPAKKECREAAKILEGAMPFVEQLYDLEDNAHLHQVVEAASPQKMIIGVFSHLQLGLSNEWLRGEIKKAKTTRDKVMREYLNRRVSIQEKPIIPEETLNEINASKSEVKWTQIVGSKFVIYWYVDEETVKSPTFRQRPIVVGGDSSEMIGRDSTTLVGVDPRDLSTVFTFCCNEGNITKVGSMVAKLMMMYPNITFVPENKSSGTAIIDSVSLILSEHGHNPFTRMFNWVVNNRDDERFAKIDIRSNRLLDTSLKKYFGVKTDKTKRDELYSSVLLEATKRAAKVIKDQRLISELTSLTERNGRVDHEVGSHDDTVIAWLMAMWFIFNAKHHELYGIKPGSVMSLAQDDTADRNRMEALRQQAIRDKIAEQEEAANRQTDPARKRILLANARALRTLIDDNAVISPTTADELYRDPKKYTDQEIARSSVDPVRSKDIEDTLISIFRN